MDLHHIMPPPTIKGGLGWETKQRVRGPSLCLEPKGPEGCGADLQEKGRYESEEAQEVEEVS